MADGTNQVQTKAVTSVDDVVRALAAELRGPLLAGEKVLWLVSGGSSVPVAIAVSKLLADADTTSLFVSLVDDKITTANEQGGNWQVLQAGGFVVGKATLYCLGRRGASLDELAKAYDEILRDRLAWADVSVGQFGIGADYHTGGILPGSPAATETERLALGYEHEGEGKITVTPALLARLDVAFINSTGEQKRPVVAHFLQSDAPIQTEPAQALKRASAVYVYSDVLPE